MIIDSASFQQWICSKLKEYEFNITNMVGLCLSPIWYVAFVNFRV